MAEFCREYFFKTFEVDLKKKKIILSKDLELCETCGEWKNVVVKVVERNPIKGYLKARMLKRYSKKS